MDDDRNLFLRGSDGRSVAWTRRRRIHLLADQALSPRWCCNRDSLSWPEALASRTRVDLWDRRCDLGIQRHVIDGSVSVVRRSIMVADDAEYRSGVAPARAACGIRSEASARSARRTTLVSERT